MIELIFHRYFHGSFNGNYDSVNRVLMLEVSDLPAVKVDGFCQELKELNIVFIGLF